jgi:hypothetical protein
LIGWPWAWTGAATQKTAEAAATSQTARRRWQDRRVLMGVRVGEGLGTDEGGKHAFETAAKAPGFA